MDPNNLDARLLSGRATFALNGKGDQDDGIRQVEEAIRLNPKASGAYSLLGAMQDLRGDDRGRREVAQARRSNWIPSRRMRTWRSAISW